jgi:hypothetical protein
MTRSALAYDPLRELRMRLRIRGRIDARRRAAPAGFVGFIQ